MLFSKIAGKDSYFLLSYEYILRKTCVLCRDSSYFTDLVSLKFLHTLESALLPPFSIFVSLQLAVSPSRWLNGIRMYAFIEKGSYSI